MSHNEMHAKYVTCQEFTRRDSSSATSWYESFHKWLCISERVRIRTRWMKSSESLSLVKKCCMHVALTDLGSVRGVASSSRRGLHILRLFLFCLDLWHRIPASMVVLCFCAWYFWYNVKLSSRHIHSFDSFGIYMYSMWLTFRKSYQERVQGISCSRHWLPRPHR